MSVVKLLKDHNGQKKGAVIPNVPFLEAKEMVAAGIAERPNQPVAKAAAESPDLKAKVGELTAENEKLKAEVADLKGLLEKATKPEGKK
jgi:DNA anti-recombination protein RmuC